MRIRKVLKVLLILFLCGLGVLGIFAYSHRVFLARLVTYPQDKAITSAAWYKPLARVKAGPLVRLPPAPKPAKPLALALQKAAAYAQKKRSSALLVVHHGKILAEHYWRGHSAKAHTNSMSMAKTILALAIGIAQKQGKLPNENTPAARFLPTWQKDARKHILLRHLLQMHSGLRCDSNIKNPFSDVVQLYMGTSLPQTLLQIPAAHKPNSRYRYNNADNQLLGLILRRATKTPYAAYLSQHLWRHLGTQDAFVWLDQPGGSAKTFCCFFANTRDWAKVGLLILHKGKANGKQLVPTAWIQRMLQPSTHEADYGYQIWLGSPHGRRRKQRSAPFLVKDLVYLDGKGKQRVYIIPSHQLVIVRTGENARGWDDAFLPNTIVRALKTNTPQTLTPAPTAPPHTRPRSTSSQPATP